MTNKPTTATDRALALETVYYSAPIPRDLGTLTVLGAVFDKVYFPGVYLPKQGFDQKELDKEIARIAGLDPGASRPGDTEILLAMLRFTKYAKVLDGFCEFSSDGHAFGTREVIAQDVLEDFYFLVHGRGDPNWHPMFMTGFNKGLPGSEEYIAYPGDYHYLFHAVSEAQRRRIPLLNDRPDGIPMAGAVTTDGLHNDAKTLSAILAVECAKLALPEMPVMTPEELMQFRGENVDALRAYRRAMLQYAGELGGKLKGLSATEIEGATSFFVQTEIVPTLDALRGSFSDPAMPWYKRWATGARVLAGIGAGYFTMDPMSASAVAVAKAAGVIASEVMAEGDHRAALKRSGLYYLLRLEQAHQRK